MTIDVQDAVRRSIQTEKNAMCFYQLAAARMKNPDALRVFNLLAREEREHAASFFAIYQGGDIASFDGFMDAPPEHQSEWLVALDKKVTPDFTEQKAMELALDREKRLEESLRHLAGQIDDPEVRKVFEMNAEETHRHYELIEAEYARLMGMVHESDMNTFVRE